MEIISVNKNSCIFSIYRVKLVIVGWLVNEKVTVNTIAEQSKKKKKRKTTVILGDSIVNRIQGRKLGRKAKQDVIVKSFPGAKLYCMP